MAKIGVVGGSPCLPQPAPLLWLGRQHRHAAYTMVDDDETVVVAGQLRDGTFDLQVESGPRQLALHIYAAEEIKRVVCRVRFTFKARVGFAARPRGAKVPAPRSHAR